MSKNDPKRGRFSSASATQGANGAPPSNHKQRYDFSPTYANFVKSFSDKNSHFNCLFISFIAVFSHSKMDKIREREPRRGCAAAADHPQRWRHHPHRPSRRDLRKPRHPRKKYNRSETDRATKTTTARPLPAWVRPGYPTATPARAAAGERRGRRRQGATDTPPKRQARQPNTPYN